MGYYDNPPMVQPDRSGLIMADSITKASESIAKGLIDRGARTREEEKERKLTVLKMQENKNKVDLAYNSALSNWSKETSGQDVTLNNAVYNEIRGKITLAADSQLELLTETDQTKRQELLTNIRNADSFLENSAKFGESFAMKSATWREASNALKVGVPGGYVVNGSTDEEIMDNTAVLEIVGGMNQNYPGSSVSVSSDDKGDGVLLNVKGKHEDGREFNVTINSKEYMAADKAGGGGMLLPVEKLDDFRKDQIDGFTGKEGMLPAYLSTVTQTVDIPSKGGDVYQYRNAQYVEEDLVRSRMKTKSDARAAGVLASYTPSALRAFVDYSMGDNHGYYDDVFKNIKDPNVQKETLSKMLTDNSFNIMVSEFKTTVDNTGKKRYWNPTADVAIKPKPEKVKVEAPEKPAPTNYKSEYYDNVINDEKPENLVTSLNKLKGSSDDYVSRSELFERWSNESFMSGTYATGKTRKEEYATGSKKKSNLNNDFEKLYPAKKGQVYVKTASNTYAPVKGYNLKLAADRIKLALDQTSDAGDRKTLQGKLKDARLMDWTKANPKKAAESIEQYIGRAKKAGF